MMLVYANDVAHVCIRRVGSAWAVVVLVAAFTASGEMRIWSQWSAEKNGCP